MPGNESEYKHCRYSHMTDLVTCAVFENIFLSTEMDSCCILSELSCATLLLKSCEEYLHAANTVNQKSTILSLKNLMYIPSGKTHIQIPTWTFINHSCRTILYEMLTKKFPFAADRLGFTYEPQVIIYLIGMGQRQEFKNHDTPKKLKVCKNVKFWNLTWQIFFCS